MLDPHRAVSERSAQETSTLLQNQAEEYREFVRGFVQKNAVMEKVFLVVVSFKPVSIPTLTIHWVNCCSKMTTSSL